MSFRTKVDFSSNRQVKQFIETQTILSGGTSFGLTFSELPTGPDLSTSGITDTFVSVVSTFSGNTGTTNYSWYDPRMALGESGLSALTPSNSALTQNTVAYEGYNPITIDGNISFTQYSGVSFDVSNISMVSLGAGAYSGSVTSFMFDIIYANPLDFQGRTIWADVSGITRTERLIVTNTPIIGYVLTCSNSEGMGEWTPVSGSTYANYLWVSGTSGTGSIRVNNGSGSDATGDYAVSEGAGTLAVGNYSHAEGVGSIASGTSSHAEGTGNYAIGDDSHAEGANSEAHGIASHTEGSGTFAYGENSHSEGAGTKTYGNNSHAGGDQSIASGNTSFVHGSNSIAGGNGTIVLGDDITGTTANRLYINSLDIKTLSTYADNAAATVGGLTVGTVYKTPTGDLKIRY